MLMKQFTVHVKRFEQRWRDFTVIDVVFSEHIEHLVVFAHVVLVPFELSPAQVLNSRQAALAGITADEQFGLHFVQNTELEVLVQRRLQEVQTPSVNGADEHLDKPVEG